MTKYLFLMIFLLTFDAFAMEEEEKISTISSRSIPHFALDIPEENKNRSCFFPYHYKLYVSFLFAHGCILLGFLGRGEEVYDNSFLRKSSMFFLGTLIGGTLSYVGASCGGLEQIEEKN